MLVPRLPYIIVYRIESPADEGWLAIVGVYHGAQHRPRTMTVKTTLLRITALRTPCRPGRLR
jgi:hypothetical protein